MRVLFVVVNRKLHCRYLLDEISKVKQQKADLRIRFMDLERRFAAGTANAEKMAEKDVCVREESETEGG